MKFIKALLILSLLVLSACSSKWYQPHPDMPDELREEHEAILEEFLGKLEESESVIYSFEVAYRYHQLGDYRKAVEYYEQTLSYNVNHEVALNNLASLYEDIEEYELAAEYIKRLYELKQDDNEAISDTVRILLKAGDDINAELALDNYESLVYERYADQEFEEIDPAYAIIIEKLRQSIEDWRAENSE